MKIVLAGLLIVSGLATAADLKPGDPAPSFTLQGSDGKSHELAQLKGHAVVLAWFPKPFSGGCTAECKSFRESGESLRKYDVNYFAISTFDLRSNTNFAESLSCDYPILADPDKKVAEAYGVLMPDGAHANRWTYTIGPDGKILEIDKQVKAQTAGPDLVARLGALKVPKRKGAPAKN